jgi:hypothetical protein
MRNFPGTVHMHPAFPAAFRRTSVLPSAERHVPLQTRRRRPDRREFIRHTAAGSAAWLGATAALRGAPDSREGPVLPRHGLQLASFRFDVTPPSGHPLCGGWIKPVEAIDDPLEAIGIILMGNGPPIVLCAVDWTGLLNDAHLAWRSVLARACGTTTDRVAVHCVHQHNAPFACVESQQVVAAQGDLPHIIDLDFFHDCLQRAAAAVRRAVSSAQSVTHVAHGSSRVDRVASNRRVDIRPDGTVGAMRGSSCKDERLRALPEGLIDPILRTVAFYNGDSVLAACHYYATHPMSYYGNGRVSSDFVGLARKRRQSESPDTTEIYFTGCAGNIAAGKYNDGSAEMRSVLADRIHEAMAAAEGALKPEPIGDIQWKTCPVLLPPLRNATIDQLAAEVSNRELAVVARNRPTYRLTWMRRAARRIPIVVSSLHVNRIVLLHLPAEAFVEYQLGAQEAAANRFVATAAYGDGGPWYLPTEKAYPEGGYEVSVAFCDPEADAILTDAIRTVIS